MGICRAGTGRKPIGSMCKLLPPDGGLTEYGNLQCQQMVGQPCTMFCSETPGSIVKGSAENCIKTTCDAATRQSGSQLQTILRNQRNPEYWLASDEAVEWGRPIVPS